VKGIIFNLLQQVVSQEYGEQTWDDLLDDAGLDGVYTAVGTYSHEQLLALVGAASQRLSLPSETIERWFGRAALPLLADRYPVFFEGQSSTREFLLTLNDVIHPEVRKLFPGAYAPSFEFSSDGEDISMSYRSHRNLCSFAEGLLEGAAAHFGQTVEIDQPQCGRRGDDHCMLHVTFAGA
jgi:hypothetical protein